MWVWKSPKETSIWKGLSYLDSTCKIGLTTNLHRFPKLFHYSDKLYTWPHDSILAVSNSKVSCNESDANLWDTSTWKADHINVSAVWYQHLPSITQKKQLHTRHRQSWPIIPQKKTMKNQINTLLPTNINISPMDNPNKKKHWRMKSSPLRGPGYPPGNAQRSHIPACQELRSASSSQAESRRPKHHGVFTCRTCPPKVPLKKYTKWVSLSLMIYKWGVTRLKEKHPVLQNIVSRFGQMWHGH